MKYNKLRWMRWLSDPITREMNIRSGYGNEISTLNERPLSLVIDDKSWAFATNGAAALAVRAYVDFLDASRYQRAYIEKLLKPVVNGEQYKLDAFKKWLGTGWFKSLPCMRCKGDWAKCCPDCLGVTAADAICKRCGDRHACTCSRCLGSGKLYCYDCAGSRRFVEDPGIYGDIVFDRGLLARFLAHVDPGSDGVIKIMETGKLSPLHIEQNNGKWRAVIMPLRIEPVKGLSRWGRR